MAQTRQRQPIIEVRAGFPASAPEHARVVRKLNIPKSTWQNITSPHPNSAFQDFLAIRFQRVANLPPYTVHFQELALTAVNERIPPPILKTPTPQQQEPLEVHPPEPPAEQLTIDFGDGFNQQEIRPGRNQYNEE